MAAKLSHKEGNTHAVCTREPCTDGSRFIETEMLDSNREKIRIYTRIRKVNLVKKMVFRLLLD